MELERGEEVRREGAWIVAALDQFTCAGWVLMEAWSAWKEGLGQEEFVRKKRMREMEEAKARVVEEEKKIGEEADEREETAKTGESDGKVENA